MHALLNHHGRRVTLTIPNIPEASMGIWGWVADEVTVCTIKRSGSSVKIEGPTEHALWALWLYYHHVVRYGRVIGLMFDEAPLWEAFRALQADIREQRGC